MLSSPLKDFSGQTTLTISSSATITLSLHDSGLVSILFVGPERTHVNVSIGLWMQLHSLLQILNWNGCVENTEEFLSRYLLLFFYHYPGGVWGMTHTSCYNNLLDSFNRSRRKSCRCWKQTGTCFLLSNNLIEILLNIGKFQCYFLNVRFSLGPIIDFSSIYYYDDYAFLYVHISRF